jgi:hypothetical protein
MASKDVYGLFAVATPIEPPREEHQWNQQGAPDKILYDRAMTGSRDSNGSIRGCSARGFVSFSPI